MNPEARRRLAPLLFAALALFTPILTGVWINRAAARLAEAEADPDEAAQVAVASAADEGYCSTHLKKVLRRVLTSCGLIGGEGRGCQPVEARAVASLAGEDFNDLFLPLSERAGIVQFDKDDDALDDADAAMLERIFSDKRGASYFFVVSRSSPDGDAAYNRALSQRRGDAVLGHLQQTFQDPDLEKQVGLLWLGEEFAQLDQGFCGWTRSGPAEACAPHDLNRSAFVAWIDCTL